MKIFFHDVAAWLVLILFISFPESSRATPQTRDVDLKLAQMPPLILGQTPDFHGLRTKLVGTLTGIDLRFYAEAITALDLRDVTAVNPGDYDFDGIQTLTGLDSFLALLPESDVTLQLAHCGLTDVSDFIAIFNAASGTNINLNLDNNPVNGAIGNLGRTSTGVGNLSLGLCGITSVGTLGDLNGAVLQLNDNEMANLDLSTAACSLDGAYLILSRNPLTTLVPGNGLTRGLVTANGGSIYLDECELNSSQINGLLAALVTMAINTGSVGTLNIASGGNGAPSGTGIDDVETLVLMGWSVTTN